MASPTQRQESRQFQFRRKVPAALQAQAAGKRVLIELPEVAGQPAVSFAVKLDGKEVKFSLRTSEKDAARLRSAAANVVVERAFAAMRSGPTPLSHRQLVAVAGEVHRAFVAQWEAEPDSEERWASQKAFNRAIVEGRIGAAPASTFDDANQIERAVRHFGRDLTAGINALPPGEATDEAMEMRFGFLTDFALLRHGLSVDAATRAKLVWEVAKASTDAGWRLKRAAGGDYSPDHAEKRFPAFQTNGAGPSLTTLYDAWRNETQPSPNTLMTWRGCFRQLREFLGHDDATRITEGDVIRWKDHLLAGDRKAKTVNDSHLTALRSVLAHAVRNKTLPSNPAMGVRAAVKAVAGEGALPYTDDEVGRLLNLASKESNTYKRWLPLLAAATGARIGELAQIHAEHVIEIEGVVCIQIRPTSDGGRLKNSASERVVPVHPDVVSAGFLEMVRTPGPGPIFYKRSSRNEAKRHASKGVANHLGT